MAEYETMSRQELMTLRADIDRAIASVGDREKRAALKAAEAAAREHGFSLTELTTALGTPRARGPARGRAPRAEGAAAPRFRNPDDHAQTWSGRGRRPRWFNEHEAAGRLDAMRLG